MNETKRRLGRELMDRSFGPAGVTRFRLPFRSFRAGPVPLPPDIAASARASAGPLSPLLGDAPALGAVRQRKIDRHMSAAIDPEGERGNWAFK
jgi:hypothetical protein